MKAATGIPVKFFGQLKYSAAETLKRNPRTWSLVWNTLPRITFLLPHDKSYHGFRHLAIAREGFFLDIGANNGMTAAGFRRLNDKYRILSIEASRYHEPALQSLKARIRRFDFHILAAGSTHGELRLFTPIYKGVPIHTHTSNSREYLEVSLRRDFSPSVVERIVFEEQVVKVAPIDSLDLRPDIVKIDAEGHDLEVLKGMKQTIERARPSIMVEFNPDMMEELSDLFAKHCYNLFIYDENHDVFLPFNERRETSTWKASGLQVNLFATPAERPAKPQRALRGL
jgi:FkbM family methyltransferase